MAHALVHETCCPARDYVFALIHYGDPVPKARPRSATGKATYTPRRTRDAETALRAAIDAAAPAEPLDVPVGMELVFHRATRRRVDGDNLAKLVTDCLQRGRRDTGGVVTDDFLIRRWEIDVHLAAPGEQPRTEVRVWVL